MALPSTVDKATVGQKVFFFRKPRSMDRSQPGLELGRRGLNSHRHLEWDGHCGWLLSSTVETLSRTLFSLQPMGARATHRSKTSK